MAGPSVSSRGRSSSPSPSGHRKPYPSSSTSSSSSTSFANAHAAPCSSPPSVSSHYSANGAASGLPRPLTPGRGDFAVGRPPPPVASPSADELINEEASRSGDSISVTVRFRPMSEREFQRGDEIAWYADGDKIVRNEYNPATAYAFDRVFAPATVSKEVYDTAGRPVVKAAMDGINGTVFAYGVTSSGKTHTMHGDQDSPGVIPLAIKDVFSMIQDTPGREFLLRVSYLEIYNEVINDLLDPTGQNLRVREDAQGTYVEGIKEEVVLSPGHALSFIAAGEEHRHVGSNNFNLLSSRSHTIFTLMIESSAHNDEYDGVTFSQLNLIDLAGSESSKTETTGLRRKEGSFINKSLLTLGTVIGKLSEGKASHVPYRDSKLTRLLQSSLSGHGHVSLICTLTPASSNMEETHNTLKFASRAKRVEIHASRNKIIDEKSLIKKYQCEISTLKQELDQLKKGVITGVNQEEINILRQQLEEGQVKMRSRLEEEEDAKAALMSRIQRLTKLILVSTKNTIPGCLNDGLGHQRHQSSASGDDDKLDVLCEVSPLVAESNGAHRDPLSSVFSTDQHRRWPGKLNEEQCSISSSITESTQAEDNFGVNSGGLKMSMTGITMSDQLDLLVEQVKMLAGEIAFGTSSLKRLTEQSANVPDVSKIQTQILEREIQEKRMQMVALEQQITEINKASMTNASLVDMQQTITRLMAQCNEKGFELELRTADNRILQEQLQQKSFENQELHEKILDLQKLSDSAKSEKYSLPSEPSEENEVLKRKIQFQDIQNEKLNIERLQLLEEITALQIHKQKLAEEASYAKELASAAAVELKILAEEVTKLSLQNAKQAKELLAAQDMAYSRSANTQACSGGLHKYSDGKIESTRLGRRNRPNNSNRVYDDAVCWNLELDGMKTELHAGKQREAVLEATLAEKEFLEEEYKRKYEEANKRETVLENDLAGMWVLVAKLKKGVLGVSELNVDEKLCNGYSSLKENNNQIKNSSLERIQHPDELLKYNRVLDVSEYDMDETLNSGINFSSDFKENNNENDDNILNEKQIFSELLMPDADQYNQSADTEPLLVHIKAQIQEMKEKKIETRGNGDTNSHV